MLVNMTLKRVVDFHGHLCPELVIGCKACEYAQNLLSKDGKIDDGISVVAENSTSALDAIQVLLGATPGNQRLKIYDFGKHNYIFSLTNGQNGFRLSLKELNYTDEDEYETLEEKIIGDQACLNDLVQFQGILDNRIKRLLASCPEDLFTIENVRPMHQITEMPTIYLTCWGCGQQVLRSRAVEFEGRIYCIPCFQGIESRGPKQNLH